MRVRLRRFWDNLNSGFWFFPAVLLAASALLAVLTLRLDENYFEGRQPSIDFLWTGDADGARELLATVAASIITVAGVVFSILIVALALASQQFGPRLLRNFTRDRGNQLSLGVFIGTFLYCLLVLRTVRHGPGETSFVPNLSVTTAIVLTTTSLGVLIYFIHHVATAIQAENVVAAVGRELDAAIRLYFPDSARTHRNETCDAEGFDFSTAAPVPARRTGYLQAIDTEALIRLAEQHDLLVRATRRPGHFITEGAPVAWVCPAAKCTPGLAQAVCDTLMVGNQRTATHDIEYSIYQLVEVAVRSMSAGINDPFTAIACVDWLGAAIVQIAHRSFPPACRYDGQGRLRLILNMVDFEGIVNAALDQIREVARDNVAVSVRILEVLATIAGQAPTSEQRQILLKHARMVRAQCETAFPEEHDRAAARERYEAVLRAAGENNRPPG